MDHDLFATPHAVVPTIEQRRVPIEYRNSDAGRALGATMPMWRVQTEGYKDGKDQLIGIVSSERGFLDSPDTEWISGGANGKSLGAVALGRHGNFFHWGFAASPTYLTAEAKLVLVNAIHYIARFDGQAPIARKVAGSMMRSDVEAALVSLTDEGYAAIVARYEGYRSDELERKARIRERLDAGEDVPDWERAMAAAPLVEIPARMDAVARFIDADTLASLGDDSVAAGAYLRRVLPYLRPTGWYTLGVDEELAQLGVANNDLRVIQRAIELALHTDASQSALGLRLLERYTDRSFTSAAEWAEWYAASRERLFFSESCGYKWLVDTITPSEVRSKLEPSKSKPLVAAAELRSLGDGRHELTVRIAILEGWHAYDRVMPGSAYRETTLDLELPTGVRMEGAWQRPTSRLDPHSPGVTVFEGSLEFTCTLIATGPIVEVACALGYQVCDDSMCLPPTTVRLVAQ